jgi:hypothetical protein
MKYLIAFLFPLSVLAADLKVDVTDFKQTALTYTTVKVAPVGGAINYGGKLVTGDAREVKTDTNGIAWFSNSVPRRYTIEVSGPITKTLATIQFTNTSGVVNASEHVTTSALPSQAYSTSASDGRFVQIANPKLLTESTPGYIWTATNASGHGHWAESAAAVGTNGLATIDYVDSKWNPFTAPYTIVFEGDSLTANTDGYWKFLTNKVGYVGLGTVANVATGGNSIQDVTNQFSSEVLPHAPVATGTNAVEFLWIGANGFYSTSDINFTFQRLSNHWLQIKSNGFALVAFTITPRGDSYVTDWGLAESNRFLINKWIRESTIPDYIIDAATMFPDCFDSTVYLDAVHINTNAHARLAEEVDYVLRQGRRRVVPDTQVGFQVGLSNHVIRSRSGETLMTLEDDGGVAIKSAISFPNGARIFVSGNYMGIQYNSNAVWLPSDTSSVNSTIRLGLQKDTIFGRQGPGAFLFAPAASGVPLYANFYGDTPDGNDNILSLLSQSNGYPSLIYSRVTGTNILAPIAVRIGANTNAIFNTNGTTRFYGDVTGTRFVGDGSGLTNLPGGTGTVTGGTNLVENNGTGVQTFFYDLADGVLRFRALEVESGPFVLNDSGYTVGLNMPPATGTNDGYLPAADFAAFSGKTDLATVAASFASGSNDVSVGTFYLEGATPSTIAGFNTSSNLSSVTLGAGLSFDGTTLLNTGQPATANGTNWAGIAPSSKQDADAVTNLPYASDLTVYLSSRNVKASVYEAMTGNCNVMLTNAAVNSKFLIRVKADGSDRLVSFFTETGVNMVFASTNATGAGNTNLSVKANKVGWLSGEWTATNELSVIAACQP